MVGKTKVLYVHHAGGLGGAPRSLSILLENIDENLIDAKLLCIFKGPALELFKDLPIKLILDEGISPFHGSTVVKKSFKTFFRNIIRVPQSFTRARKQIRLAQPDIIHLNSSCLFIVACAAKSLNSKIKVICHVREPLRTTLSGRIIREMCYRFVDQFIAIDHYTGSSMLTKDNLLTVYNSVDFRSYNPGVVSNRLKQELKLSGEAIIFLFLARVAPSNGALELVKTAKKLCAEYPSFHFVIAGLKADAKDSYSTNIVSEARDETNIHLMDFRTDVTDIIASADVMVAPFTEPHFARSVIEAAAMGKPSIGSNIGGVDELILHGQTGYLYNNMSELESSCIELGTNREKRQIFGQEAANFALRNFDSVSSSKVIFDLYRKIL